MSEDFIKVYSAGKLYDAELVKGMLFENGIEATIINKRDTEFLVGEVELYVSKKDSEKAVEIINQRGE